jgi:aryl-phospho-beta-D-glucosidase BglC (GH1 family)
LVSELWRRRGSPLTRYWDVIEGEPFPPPNPDETDPDSPLFYLKRALGWLDELGMKGLIDLHAGPGQACLSLSGRL